MAEITSTLILIALMGTTPPRPDVLALSRTHQTVFNAVAAEEYCGCDSPASLKGCIERFPTCRIANHLANFVAQEAAAGHNTDTVLANYAHIMGKYCGVPATFSLDSLPSKGTQGAAVTVVEFADFRCSHCAMQVPKVKALLRQLGAHVQFYFVPFPLNGHPQSLLAAYGLLAAGAQGKFWEMHDALFAGRPNGFARQNVIQFAQNLGLEMKQFKQDLDSDQVKQQVASLQQQGRNAGVMGTPTFFINGRHFPSQTTKTLAQYIKMELDRNKGTCQ